MPESLVLAAGATPIAGYTLVRLLGRGGFGEVWEARAPGDFPMALKFLRLERREAAVEQRALELIRNIRHANLLDVQFAARVADCLVIAMPLCDHSLRERLNACLAEGRPGLPRNELLRLMNEVAGAVDFLNEPRHRAEDGSLVGVQHRDIKPDNIFLVGGTARLADFGLARILSATLASTKGSMTPNYAAPEVIEGHYSKWSDQYSLAASYCELRTGHPPFEGENALQVIYAHVNRPPDLSALPEEERKAVARALAKRPEERWPTCRKFVQALVAGSREDDHRASTPGVESVAPPVGGTAGVKETVVPPPIPPTRIDDGTSLGGSPAASVTSGQSRSTVLLVLPFALVGLVGMVIIAWLLRPPARPQTNVPAPPIASATPAPARPPAPPPPDEPPPQITNTIGMKLVLIPAGDFLMGSPASDSDARDDERPQHPVRITQPFYLGATEVTQGQYRAVTGQNPSYFKGADDLPVESVSWNDAVAFCDKLNEKERASLEGYTYLLPTEAEWEYACRAGSTTRYSFGDDVASLGDYAWFSGNSRSKTHPVGQKRPNAYNLHDMHGNVWEWCQDWYDTDYYGRSPRSDPPGPPQAAFRVGRGGSWDYDPAYARSAFRSSSTPVIRLNRIGFRVTRVQAGLR
jgi:formylglycine-generating enzyme required for sulfatase activity